MSLPSIVNRSFFRGTDRRNFALLMISIVTMQSVVSLSECSFFVKMLNKDDGLDVLR